MKIQMSCGSELRIEKCMQQFVFVKVALTEIHVCEKYTDVRSILCSASYNITESDRGQNSSDLGGRFPKSWPQKFGELTWSRIYID